MLIKEIEPIDEIGVNLLEEDNPDKIIDEIIELPLRNACKEFRKKGIQTVMSSCNKNNLLKPGEKRIEKEDIKDGWLLLNSPSFSDAGKGYGWIMLDFDSLSDENKDILFNLEERVDNKGKIIGEKAIWFIHPSIMGNLEYDIRCGRRTHEELSKFLFAEEMQQFQDVKFDERLAEFEKKSIILRYNNRYPANTVLIRMPITEETKVEEVEEYFLNFAKNMKNQQKELEKDSR